MFFITKSNIGIICLGTSSVTGVYATKFLWQNQKLLERKANIKDPIHKEKTLLEHLSFSNSGKNKKCQILLENSSKMIDKCSPWMEKMNQYKTVTDILNGDEEEVLKKLKDLVIDINSLEKIEGKRIWKRDKITCNEQDKFEGDTRIICSKNTSS